MPRGRFFVSFPARVPLFSLYCNDCVTAALNRSRFLSRRQQSTGASRRRQTEAVDSPVLRHTLRPREMRFSEFRSMRPDRTKARRKILSFGGLCRYLKKRANCAGRRFIGDVFFAYPTGTLPIKCVLSGKGAPIRILQAAVFILRGCAYSRRSTVSSRRRSRASSR